MWTRCNMSWSRSWSCWTPQRPLVLSFLFLCCFLLLLVRQMGLDRALPWSGAAARSSVQNCSAPAGGALTVLLVWKWPFGFTSDPGCESLGVAGCRVTAERSEYGRAHAVFFHHRDIDPADLPAEPRPCFQKWVWSNMESPTNAAAKPQLDALFNLTCSYRLDSDVPVPYGHLVPVAPANRTVQVPEKRELVCWVVSNWNPQHRRVRFYQELKKHVDIGVYGQASGRRLSNQDYERTVSGCKFYLSWENSQDADYITEKFFAPMMLGSVPVVLGPPRQNYEKLVPADAFIHVDDFPSAERLAERLRHLDQNHQEYRSFFDWTRSFKVQRSTFGSEQICRTCQYLQTHRGRQVQPHLNKWFWH